MHLSPINYAISTVGFMSYFWQIYPFEVLKMFYNRNCAYEAKTLQCQNSRIFLDERNQNFFFAKRTVTVLEEFEKYLGYKDLCLFFAISSSSFFIFYYIFFPWFFFFLFFFCFLLLLLLLLFCCCSSSSLFPLRKSLLFVNNIVKSLSSI